MKKRTSFALVFALMCVLVMCCVLPVKASAACKHEERVEDECVKCGDLRVWSTKSKRQLLFVARYNGNDAPRSHKEGRGSSKTVNWYKAGDRLYVVGRTRNKHGNLWLKLSDGSFIWSEYAAFDFDATVNEANGLVRSLIFSKEWYLYMGLAFRPDGPYDLKVINLLGNRYKEYYVYSNGIIQDRKMSGEELGNILYGCVFARSGKGLDEAIRSASAVDLFSGVSEFNKAVNAIPSNSRKALLLLEDAAVSLSKWQACWYGHDYSMCDDNDENNNDKDLVALGYWIEEHRSSNSCVPWNYDVTSPY